MTARNHNKKRNSLLMYEFLVRTISRALIENDKSRSAAALKILRRHFKPGTELHKEFRLMNAIARTTVSSPGVAASILGEARAAVVKFDTGKLDREKSHLIRNINHTINDPGFYDQHVAEYRTFATIQMLVNEWTSSDKDLKRLASFEDHVTRHLITERTTPSDELISEDTAGTARVLMKVMTKKLNEKYGSSLNEQQKSLIKAYAYSTASDDDRSIVMKLNEVRADLMGLIDGYVNSNDPNEYLKNKLTETRTVLEGEDLTAVDDSTVTRFMLYSRLRDELESKE